MTRNWRKAALMLAALTLAGCTDAPSDMAADRAVSLDNLAERYVRLTLAMTPHDPAYVDAYFGPDAWRDDAAENPLSLTEIRSASRDLRTALPETGAREAGLQARLVALEARIDVLEGNAPDFDEEARQLYGSTPPDYELDRFEAILGEIDALLPGPEPLAERVLRFRNRFVIPPERLTAVFDAAIEECRRRTAQHIDLPAAESFTIEYVNDKPWSGYNWYQGNATSVIQINTDLPIYISRAVDLGCHEGYPGHHTYNALLERHLLDRQGWIEYAVYPLFSPQSLIAEGSANYGIDLAFPGDERIAYEQEHLFPLAGLDAAEAPRYYRLLELLRGLDYVDNEVARHYLNGDIDRAQAEDWLVRYKLVSPERAAQRVDFIETYRAYVINYNHGRDLVRRHVERTGADPWQAFAALLSSPVQPSDLEIDQ